MRDTDVGTVRHNCGRQQVEVGRAAPFVDVQAVGLAADRDDGRAGAAQCLGGGERSGAVRAVDDDLEAVEAVGHRGDDVVDVAVGRLGVFVHAADAGTDRALPLFEKPCFDGVLEFVGELVAAAGEELDPVVGHRIVACRQHHAEVGLQLGSQERDRRRRENTEPQHVDASTGQTRNDGRLEELTRCTRITADDREWPMAFEGAGLAEHVGCGDRELKREFGRQFLIRDPANAVGAEQPEPSLLAVDDAHRVVGHAFTAWSTAEPCGPSSDRTSCAR